LLQEVQAVYTFLPKPALQYIETELNYTLGELYAVATFYAQFKLQPSGKYSIKICKGTACHVQNVNVVMDEIVAYLKVGDGETTPDGKYTLESVSCLGCCSLAPAMMIGEETFGKLNGENAINYIKNFEE
jgi:NADH-quinone oxidoreductase subunit E